MWPSSSFSVKRFLRRGRSRTRQKCPRRGHPPEDVPVWTWCPCRGRPQCRGRPCRGHPRRGHDVHTGTLCPRLGHNVLDGDIMSSTETSPSRTSSTGTSSAGTSGPHRDVLDGDIYVVFYFCPFVISYRFTWGQLEWKVGIHWKQMTKIHHGQNLECWSHLSQLRIDLRVGQKLVNGWPKLSHPGHK